MTRKIDFTKVKTIDDIKRILEALEITFSGEKKEWEVIKDLLIPIQNKH